MPRPMALMDALHEAHRCADEPHPLTHPTSWRPPLARMTFALSLVDSTLRPTEPPSRLVPSHSEQAVPKSSVSQ
jgi:hypothetical protein